MVLGGPGRILVAGGIRRMGYGFSAQFRVQGLGNFGFSGFGVHNFSGFRVYGV